MRTRLFGFAAALILAALGSVGPVAHAAAAAIPAVTGPECVEGGGTVEYDAGAGKWTCAGGSHGGESVK